jgi:hypothetical protein
MYKQIFTPPITETYIEGEALEEMREQLKDALFMERCTELTYMMLKNKMDINTITAIIKEYQTKYFYIKKNAPKLVSAFTPEMWWKTRR